jgi:hypothetical protein
MAVLHQRTPLVRGVSRGAEFPYSLFTSGIWLGMQAPDHRCTSALPHSGHATLPVFKDLASTLFPLDLSRDDMTWWRQDHGQSNFHLGVSQILIKIHERRRSYCFILAIACTPRITNYCLVVSRSEFSSLNDNNLWPARGVLVKLSISVTPLKTVSMV